MTAVRGSCLCGGVRFAAHPPFLRAGWCHCSRCRKHSGAAGGMQARIPRDRFQLLCGEALIEVYRPADGAAVKAFCRRCGSGLFGGSWPDGDEVSIRFGAFDDDPGIRPECHTFTDDRAPWYEIHDELPRHPGALNATAPDDP